MATEHKNAIVLTPTAADRDPVKYNRRLRTTEVTLAIAVPVVLLVFLQIGADQEWWSRIFYPSVTDVVRELRSMFVERDFAYDLWVTIRRLMLGYIFGSLVGLLFGFVLGLNRLTRKALEPLLNALYTVPKIALLSPLLIAFGFYDKPIVVLIAITVFFFVWVPTQSAVMSVQASFREAATVFGVNRWQMFRHVMLPATLPSIFVTLRVAISVAILTVIGVEFVFAPQARGLGYIINDARSTLSSRVAWAGILIASVLGVTFTWIVRIAERLLLPWNKEDQGSKD
ncbi:MAG: ABC transporter permease [Actinomycetota bacterium]